MRILVTGGAGYIGSFITRKLIESRFEVLVFDSLLHGSRAAIGQAKLVEGDLRDLEALRAVFRSATFNFVIHLADLNDVAESLRIPYDYINANILGLTNVLECMKENGVKRLVFASSSQVYGSPKTEKVAEDSPFDVRSVYAETKYTGEKLIGWYDMAFGIKAIALRIFNTVGASVDGNLGLNKKEVDDAVHQTCRAILTDGVFRLNGGDHLTTDGTIVRDYVHVEDVADAFIKAVNYLGRNPVSEIFNVGSGTGHSVRQVCDEVEAQTGKRLNIVPGVGKRTEVLSICSDNSRAKLMLEWFPKFGLSDIIQTSLYWQARHPNGL